MLLIAAPTLLALLEEVAAHDGLAAYAV